MITLYFFLVSCDLSWLFLKASWVGLQCFIVVYPAHAHLLFRLFADVSAIYLVVGSATESQAQQTDLACLEQRETMWDMQFNPSKYMYQVPQIKKSETP